METLHITVNGKSMEKLVDPSLRLVDFLRRDLGLVGAKIGCGEGTCGTCTVIMNGRAIRSCVIPIMKAENAVIETIEGISKGERLHPLQEEFIKKGAVQCGFCTPGMIMSAKALLDKNNNPTPEEVRKALHGNLCRCTGYVKIEEAILAAAERLRNGEWE